MTYIAQAQPLGLAHAVLTARDFVAGQPFLMYLGDNVLLEGLGRFVEEFERTRPDAQIFLARVPEPERFGVAVLDGDRVVRLVEKPTSFVSDLALVGVYLFDDSILEAADTLEPSARGEFEITEAIQWLIDHGKIVRAEMVSAWWKDTDALPMVFLLLGVTAFHRVDCIVRPQQAGLALPGWMSVVSLGALGRPVLYLLLAATGYLDDGLVFATLILAVVYAAEAASSWSVRP